MKYRIAQCVNKTTLIFLDAFCCFIDQLYTLENEFDDCWIYTSSSRWSHCIAFISRCSLSLLMPLQSQCVSILPPAGCSTESQSVSVFGLLSLSWQSDGSSWAPWQQGRCDVIHPRATGRRHLVFSRASNERGIMKGKKKRRNSQRGISRHFVVT